jgi:hypothetical protein
MADDYARHALSQRASFEATHPAVMAAAEQLASEPVLCVADLGAADGVNSHDLIRDLVALRAGQPLIYALVDPTNAWRVAAAHLRDALGPEIDPDVMVVIPAQGGHRVSCSSSSESNFSSNASGEASRSMVYRSAAADARSLRTGPCLRKRIIQCRLRIRRQERRGRVRPRLLLGVDQGGRWS